MNESSNVFSPVVLAIDELIAETKATKMEIRNLADNVGTEAAARDRKVRALQQLTYLMIAGIIILIIAAGLNFYNTTATRQATSVSQQTNALLLSCLQPDTDCSRASQATQKAQNDQIRQTVFLLFVCSRLNPVDPNVADPEGNTQRLVTCVNQYFPDFKIPPKATPTPSSSIAIPSTLLDKHLDYP